MNNEACLILIKPDGLLKSLTGNIISALSETKLKIIGAKIVSVSRELAEKHYEHLKETKPDLYENILRYIMGEFHTNRVLALIYYGEDAIDKVRNIMGVTNPEEADPISIRGRYGRISSKTGVMENCAHSSDSKESAEKEIKLWFDPDEIVVDLYKTKTIKLKDDVKVWG